jgi:hypothetical protein
MLCVAKYNIFNIFRFLTVHIYYNILNFYGFLQCTFTYNCGLSIFVSALSRFCLNFISYLVWYLEEKLLYNLFLTVPDKQCNDYFF